MSTLERLQELLARDYGLAREEVAPEVVLESFGVDSLGMMELLFEIEKAFGIIIPNEHVELRTVGQVADYINKLAAEQGTAPRFVVQR
jgi:acyl carrier protein